MSSQSSSYDPASITITNGGTATYTATVTYPGSGYRVGNSFRVSGLMLGGASPANDLSMTISGSLSANGGIPASANLVLVGVANSAVTISVPITLDFNSTAGIKDASDITRSLRERIIYNEKRAGSPIAAIGGGLYGHGNAEMMWQQQGNNFRLAYLNGKLKCGAGFGAVFSQNGPNSFDKNGAQSGS